MKILLDENIDVDFRKDFPTDHEVYTVRYMHWAGFKNGAMLWLLKEHKFDCWVVVVDKSIPYQQNIAKLPCLAAVMDVRKNNRASRKPCCRDCCKP